MVGTIKNWQNSCVCNFRVCVCPNFTCIISEVNCTVFARKLQTELNMHRCEVNMKCMNSDVYYTKGAESVTSCFIYSLDLQVSLSLQLRFHSRDSGDN